MKKQRTIAALTLCLLFCGLSVAHAADMQTDGAMPYPTEVQTIIEGDSWQVIKTYVIPAEESPDDIPTAAFERDGRLYTLADITVRPDRQTDTRLHTEAAQFPADSADREKAVQLFPPTMDYESEDGYFGVLSLDAQSVESKAAGYKSSSYTVTATREYPHLSENDLSLIPKTVTENGRTLELDGVVWAAQQTVPAYCITPKSYGIQWFVDEGDGIPYTKDAEVTDPKVMGIIVNGYPHLSAKQLLNAEFGPTDHILAFYATKIALWCYLRDDYSIDNLRVNPSLSGDELARANAIIAAAEGIYNRGMAASTVATEYRFGIVPVTAAPHITDANRESLKVTIGGTAYYAQDFKVMTGTWVEGLVVDVTVDGENEIGAVIATADNVITSSIPIRGDTENGGYVGYFKVLYPAANIFANSEDAGTVSLSAVAEEMHQLLVYSVAPKFPADVPAAYRPGQKYLADLFAPTVSDTASAIGGWSKTDDPEYGNLIIRKYETGTTTLLGGAEFRITGPDGYDATFTTIAGEPLETGRIPVGTYTVTETKAPKNYVADVTAGTTCTVVKDETTTLDFYNTPGDGGGDDGELIIRKYETGTTTPLPGAGFLVRAGDGTTVGTYTTGAGGQICIQVEPGTYFVSEVNPPDGYVMGTETKSATVPPNGSRTLDFYNEKKPEVGELTIRKYATGTTTLLGGAHFEVKSGATGAVVCTAVTDSTGTATVRGLEPGVYFVTETQAPVGHLIATTATQNVTVVENGTGTVTFYNDPYGGLRIEKRDADSGAMLSGAVIELRNIVTGAVYSGTTTTGGAVNFTTLVPGAYEIRELVAPEGYVLDTAIHTVNVVKHDTVTYTLLNSAKPGLTIVKYDADTMELLPGVTFEVYRNAALVGTYTTDATGRFALHDLQPGTVTVKEIAAGGSHVVDSTPQSVELKAGDGIVQLVFFNRVKPGIFITKIDGTTLDRIPGVLFRVQKVGDTYYQEYTTDASGEINLTGLEPGAYTVTEISAPDGYVMDDGDRVIQVNGGESAHFVFTNTKKPGLVIVKYDTATDTYLPGATFSVRKLEDGAQQLSSTTAANGEIRLVGLDTGVYEVIETAAPDGYILDATPRHIQLYAGRTSTLIVENEAKPDLRIVKTDADTGAPLAGAVYIVRKADGATVTTVTTDANGEAWVRGLDVGTYQVIEQSPPAGYLLNATPQMITLSPNETGTVQFQNYRKPSLTIVKYDAQTMARLPNVTFEVSQVVVNNEAKPHLQIIKTDANTGERLAGATFTVKKADGETITTVTTDAKGEAFIKSLDPGVYTIAEIIPPVGYLLNDTVQMITLKPNHTGVVQFENYPKPSLTIHKVDSITKDPIKGAKFQILYASNNTFTGELRDLGYYYSDEGGIIALSELEDGWYRITELEPAKGYAIKDPATQDVFIQRGAGKVVTFENTPLSAIVIRKVDAITGAPLQGAKFQIRYLSGTSGTGGTIIGSYTTSVNGTIVITGLAAGTYIVEETKAPAGYTIDEATQTVYLSGKDQDVVTVEFTNSPDSGLLIRKLDSATGKPLAGATFKVTDSTGAVVGDSGGIYKTDASGLIHVTGLPVGAYIVQETAAPDGYVLDTASQTITLTSGKLHTLTFYNTPMGGLVINKLDSVTKEPLAGATFKVTHADGRVVGTRNGQYTTSKSGTIRIPGLEPGAYVVQEVSAADGYVLDAAPQTVELKANKTYTLDFYNTPLGGLTIVKSDEDTGARIKGARFEVRKQNGEIVGYYTTDARGTIRLPDIDSGWYTVTEIKAADGYILDATPHSVQVKDGKTATLEVFNRAKSGILIYKVDALTGNGIYGVTFLLYDGGNNPIGQYTTDQSGRVLINDGLTEGRYYLRELSTATGYELDTELKTVYVEAGKTIEVRWENQPMLGQIQITKKSGDANELNGLPTGTPLAGAVFEVYDYRTGNLMCRFVSGADGRAVSSPLPLGRYIVKEVQSPQYYMLSSATLDLDVEFAGQIVKRDFLNYSANTGVTIRKTGVRETQPGDEIRYTINEVRNTSTVPLTDFYWRDILPTDAVRLTRIVTGSYNQALQYKVIVTTSKGDTRVIADNLSTTKNNVIDCSATALGLKSDEYVTSFTLLFGTVQAGFSAVEQPQVYVKVLPNLPHQYQFTNKADVGGKYGDAWVVGNTTWTTIIYAKPQPLPKTGY